MLTTYAADVSRWPTWQKAYRYGVLLIIPAQPPFNRMEMLRRQYDPRAQAVCGTHISLTVPFTRALRDDDWYEVKSLAAGIESFVIKYGPLINFLPSPGVALDIGPYEMLDNARARLEKAAAFQGAPPRPYPFRPHMTIAEYITPERTRELTAKLKDVVDTGSFLCTGVSYYVPDEAFHFTERGRFAFS